MDNAATRLPQATFSRPSHMRWIIVVIFVAILSCLCGYLLGIRANNASQTQLAMQSSPTVSPSMAPINQTSSNGSSTEFTTFLEQVSSAKYTDYAQLPTTHVQNEQEFETMRTYILSLYAGKKIISSFKDPNGIYWDCTVVDQHPEKPPTFAPQSWGNGRTQNYTVSNNAEPVTNGPNASGPSQEVPNNRPISVGTRPTGCPAGTYPWMRVTLERLGQFPTLRDFLSAGKGPFE